MPINTTVTQFSQNSPAMHGYSSIRDAWNAPIPEKGERFKKVEEISTLTGAFVGGGLVLTALYYAEQHDKTSSENCFTACNNNCTRVQYNVCNGLRNNRGPKGKDAGVVLFVNFVGVSGFAFLGCLAANKARDLGYRTVRVITTANKIYNPLAKERN